MPIADPLIAATKYSAGVFVVKMVVDGEINHADSEAMAAALRVAAELDRISMLRRAAARRRAAL